MYPIGTIVKIQNVEHQDGSTSSKRLLGRKAVVLDHVDGMHEVALLFFGHVSFNHLRWMFYGEDLAAA